MSSFEDLLNHVGHRFECVTYGDDEDPDNVSLECYNCGEVILDFDASSLGGAPR